MTMRALTLWQPMAWAISDYTKRIENRPWRPHAGTRTICIHAGMKYHADHAHQIEDVFEVEVPSPKQIPRGAIVCVADVVRCIHEDDDDLLVMDPWFSGPYGWVLDNVRKLEAPIPCKGALGLWRIPAAVEEQVVAQLRGAA